CRLVGGPDGGSVAHGAGPSSRPPPRVRTRAADARPVPALDSRRDDRSSAAMIARLITTAVIAATVAVTAGQEVPPEYRVKAAYLYNFVKYVEWPRNDKSSILICIAGQNPFGDVLT